MDKTFFDTVLWRRTFAIRNILTESSTVASDETEPIVITEENRLPTAIWHCIVDFFPCCILFRKRFHSASIYNISRFGSSELIVEFF